jgi:hypothetical protein
VPVIDTSLITELRGLARHARQLAYSPGDKEHALLALSNALHEHVVRLEMCALVSQVPPGPAPAGS